MKAPLYDLFVFVFWVIFVLCVLACSCLFFKGQVRWPEGPPHLALNSPDFFLVGGGCPLFSFQKERRKSWPPLTKDIFAYFFSVSHCFCPSSFTPPFHSLSLYLSISFSLFLHSSCFLSFSFPIFFFLLSFFDVFLAMIICFSVLKRTSSNDHIAKVFLDIPFSFLVSCVDVASICLFAIFGFLILSCVFS